MSRELRRPQCAQRSHASGPPRVLRRCACSARGSGEAELSAAGGGFVSNVTLVKPEFDRAGDMTFVLEGRLPLSAVTAPDTLTASVKLLITSPDGPAWTLHRKVASHMFSMRLLKESTRIAARQASKLVCHLRTRGDRPVDMQSMLWVL